MENFRAFPIEADVGKKTSTCINCILNMLTKVFHSYSIFGHFTKNQKLKRRMRRADNGVLNSQKKDQQIKCLKCLFNSSGTIAA
jgi:hypothetical protein